MIKNNLSAGNKKRLNNFEEYFGLAHTGLLFYLIYKNAIELGLKHLIYFFTQQNYIQVDYLFISLYGICQTSFLVYNFYNKIQRVDNFENKSFLIMANQLSMCTLFGITQFSFQMNIWDHKYRLITLFYPELFKFSLQFIWMLSVTVWLFHKKKTFVKLNLTQLQI